MSSSTNFKQAEEFMVHRHPGNQPHPETEEPPAPVKAPESPSGDK